MEQGKALGRSQAILAFMESGHEEVIAKGKCENFSIRREMGKEKRELEAMDSVPFAVNNEWMISVHSRLKHEML